MNRDAALAKIVLFLARNPGAKEDDVIAFVTTQQSERERVEALLFDLVTNAKLLRWTNRPKTLGEQLRYALAARVVPQAAIAERDGARRINTR